MGESRPAVKLLKMEDSDVSDEHEKTTEQSALMDQPSAPPADDDSAAELPALEPPSSSSQPHEPALQVGQYPQVLQVGDALFYPVSYLIHTAPR